MSRLLQSIRRLASPVGEGPSMSDGELLARYHDDRDERAFEIVVERHGRMVMGTCLRVMGRCGDVEDAYQAAFLVLLRKAGDLRDRVCIGNYLHGIAYHTALKAVAMAKKRRMVERSIPAQTERDCHEDLLQALDNELMRLPDFYREPVVRCELEGASRKSVALALGIAEGTISSRLATAHSMLERRLKARGFESFAVVMLLASASLGQAVPSPFKFVHTLEVFGLATEVSKMLFLKKLKLVAFALGLAIIGSLGVGHSLGRLAAQEAKAPEAKPVQAAGATDADSIVGIWKTTSIRTKKSGEPELELPLTDSINDMFWIDRTKITNGDKFTRHYKLQSVNQQNTIVMAEPSQPFSGLKREVMTYEFLKTAAGKARELAFRYPLENGEIVTYQLAYLGDDNLKMNGKWKIKEDREGNGRYQIMQITNGHVDLLSDKEKNEDVKMTFRCDPTTSPKSVDFIMEHQGKKEIGRGIYELDGDRLKLCFSKNTEQGQRPKTFTADGCELSEMTRLPEEPKK